MRAALGVVVALLTAAVLVAQEPAQGPIFRATTRVVPLPTMVTDADGRFVPDLEQDQFAIFDNGKPQEILLFENATEPFTAVVMLDFSGSMTMHLTLLKQAAEQFLIRMLPEDHAQVGSFSAKIQFSGEFTNDRDHLIASLQELQFGNATRLYDAIDESIKLLEDADGRRVVLVFTDGDDTSSRVNQSAVRERAQRSDVMIYAIGLSAVFQGAVTKPDPGLRKLAEASGGGYFELKRTDDLGPTFTRVAQELHSLYSIGFIPQTLDGKEHKIQVRMKDPGHKARTRASYIAAEQD